MVFYRIIGNFMHRLHQGINFTIVIIVLIIIAINYIGNIDTLKRAIILLITMAFCRNFDDCIRSKIYKPPHVLDYC